MSPETYHNDVVRISTFSLSKNILRYLLLDSLTLLKVSIKAFSRLQSFLDLSAIGKSDKACRDVLLGIGFA